MVCNAGVASLRQSVWRPMAALDLVAAVGKGGGLGSSTEHLRFPAENQRTPSEVFDLKPMN